MRILIIVDCYFPSMKSSAKLIHDLADEFVTQGHQVTVVVPDETLNKSNCDLGGDEGVDVLRVRTGKIKGANKIIRAINEMQLSPIIWDSCKEYFQNNVHDFIVYYSPSIFFGKLVQKLKKLWGCKAYLILRDIFPQWAVDIGIMRRALPYWFFKYKELQQYSAADVIGIESSGYFPYFSRQGIDKKRHIEVLYNWTNLNKKEIVIENDRKRLGLEDKFVFFYGGNIGLAQEMDNIIRLAKNLHDHTNIHFLLVGDGSEVRRLKQAIVDNKLDNITIHPPVSQQHYPGMLSQFDVGLVSLSRKLKAHNLPGKMLGYMYFSKPILASINQSSDLKDILENSQAGFVCLSGQHKTFCDYALKLAGDRDLCRKMGQNGRKVLEEKFCVTNAVSQILSHVKMLPHHSRHVHEVQHTNSTYAELKR